MIGDKRAPPAIMHISNRKTFPVVIAALVFSVVAFGRNHNEFNGTWTLMPSKSDFAGQPVVQTGTVTIADQQGNTNVSRNFVYEGANQTFFYSDVVGGGHRATIHEGKDLKSKTTWDHDTLKVTTTLEGAITVERYAVNADGTMTATVARPDHPPFTLVFERR